MRQLFKKPAIDSFARRRIIHTLVVCLCYLIARAAMQELIVRLHNEEESLWSANGSASIVKDGAVYRASHILPVEATLFSFLLNEAKDSKNDSIRHDVALTNMFARCLAVPPGAEQWNIAVVLTTRVQYRLLYPGNRGLLHLVVPQSPRRIPSFLIGSSPWTTHANEDVVRHLNAWAALNAVAPGAKIRPSCFASAVIMNNYDLLVHGADEVKGSAASWFEGRTNLMAKTTDQRCLHFLVSNSSNVLADHNLDEVFAATACFDVLRYFIGSVSIDYSRTSIWDWVIAAVQYKGADDGVKRLQLILQPVLAPRGARDEDVVFPGSDYYHVSPIALAVAAGCMENARFLCDALYRDDVRGFRQNHPDGLLTPCDIDDRNVAGLEQLMLADSDWWTFPREILRECALHGTTRDENDADLLQLLCDLPDLLPEKFGRELPGETKQSYIDQRDHRGFTALWHTVTTPNRLRAVRILILAGADPYLKLGSELKSCLDVAYGETRGCILLALEERGGSSV